MRGGSGCECVVRTAVEGARRGPRPAVSRAKCSLDSACWYQVGRDRPPHAEYRYWRHQLPFHRGFLRIAVLRGQNEPSFRVAERLRREAFIATVERSGVRFRVGRDRLSRARSARLIAPAGRSPVRGRRRVCVTQRINSLVPESQLPHKTVNLIFELVIVNDKLKILWGS